MSWKYLSLALTASVATLALQAAVRPAVADEAAGAIRCKLFARNLDTTSLIDTSDATSEVGLWVASQAEQGWRVRSVDFETAQKSTGFPQGFTEVCVAR